MAAATVIVDYGMGNLWSVWQAAAVAADDPDNVVISTEPGVVLAAERVILPGQGAMPECMAELNRSGLREAITEAAQSKPFLGVCVGMQMLLDASDEGSDNGEGGTLSLGFIPGRVVKFVPPVAAAAPTPKIPQMGWNQVRQSDPRHPMWAEVPDNAWFYFVHSYYARPESEAHVAATTEYMLPFASAVVRDNLFATQFHPEKSAAAGIQLYRNFLRWRP